MGHLKTNVHKFSSAALICLREIDAELCHFYRSNVPILFLCIAFLNTREAFLFLATQLDYSNTGLIILYMLQIGRATYAGVTEAAQEEQMSPISSCTNNILC